jgi:aminoglycoside phosphotransferase family enzyme/predicted kinase
MASAEDEQCPVVAFLSKPAAYGRANGPVEQITTHISHVFLTPDRAYKLKRAVRLPYLDFSTPDLRRAACERELMLNRRTAPELYERVSAITRRPEGSLALDGGSSAVDWLVMMRRFDGDRLLDRVAEREGLAQDLLVKLADTIWDFHRAEAPAQPAADVVTAMSAVIDGIEESFAACPSEAFAAGVAARVVSACRNRLGETAELLRQRQLDGKIRHCHGDLHLRNICLIGDRPVLFDCIEFSDALATIDVLYDLAFLLMDLLHRRLGPAANLVFNRYLDRSGDSGGIALLPLFLALRASIRAHVLASATKPGADFAEPRAYLDLAQDFLEPHKPRLVAVGGLSGTGKSTLAYGLAPDLGAAPGARVLRSDVIRKRLFSLAPEARLPEAAYTQEVTAKVYAALADEAGQVLRAGHSVFADAVFADPAERDQVAAAARSARAGFVGLWLEAPQAELERRIGARRNDASDATVEVLRRQLDFDLGRLDWRRVDVSGSAAQALANARAAIAESGLT